MEQIDNQTEIKTIIKNYILSNAGITEMEDDLDIFEAGIVNSLFVIQLVTFLEKKFGFKIVMEDMEMTNYNSIDNLGRFVQHKLHN